MLEVFIARIGGIAVALAVALGAGAIAGGSGAWWLRGTIAHAKQGKLTTQLAKLEGEAQAKVNAIAAERDAAIARHNTCEQRVLAQSSAVRDANQSLEQTRRRIAILTDDLAATNDRYQSASDALSRMKPQPLEQWIGEAARAAKEAICDE